MICEESVINMSNKKGSRWDRPADDAPKRKVSAAESSDDDEPGAKKASMTAEVQPLNLSSSRKKEAPKIAMNIGGLTAKPGPVKISLGSSKAKESAPPVLKPKATVAQAFNADDSSDEEEMPAEARMRMRNLGKDTPTASGPNSFGKNRLGFCDRQKVIQKELQKQMEEVSSDKK